MTAHLLIKPAQIGEQILRVGRGGLRLQMKQHLQGVAHQKVTGQDAAGSHSHQCPCQHARELLTLKSLLHQAQRPESQEDNNGKDDQHIVIYCNKPAAQRPLTELNKNIRTPLVPHAP